MPDEIEKLKLTGSKLPPDMRAYLEEVSQKHDNVGLSYVIRQFLKYAIKEHKAGKLKLFP